MQRLTNLRFRFNDGDLLKVIAYPEVDLRSQGQVAQLFSSKFNSQNAFDTAFQSIIWVSYRRGFEPLVRITGQLGTGVGQINGAAGMAKSLAPGIAGTGGRIGVQNKYQNMIQVKVPESNLKRDRKLITSDCGWGCMIRCSQMMLANTIAKLAREDPSFLPLSHLENLALFLDQPDKPFGIFQMTEEGRRSMEREPGDWYGVNSIAQVIKNIFRQRQQDEMARIEAEIQAGKQNTGSVKLKHGDSSGSQIFKKMSFLTF